MAPQPNQQDPRLQQTIGMTPQGTAMPGGPPVGPGGMPPQRMGMTAPGPRMAPPWAQAAPGQPGANLAGAIPPAAVQPPAAGGRMSAPWQGQSPRPQYQGQAPGQGPRAQTSRPQQPGTPMQMRQQRQGDMNQQGGNAF